MAIVGARVLVSHRNIRTQNLWKRFPAKFLYVCVCVLVYIRTDRRCCERACTIILISYIIIIMTVYLYGVTRPTQDEEMANLWTPHAKNLNPTRPKWPSFCAR